VIYDYLPDKKKKEYAFNQAVAIKLEQGKKLNTIIPMKGDKLQFNQKITDAFAAVFLWIFLIFLTFFIVFLAVQSHTIFLRYLIKKEQFLFEFFII